MAATTTKETETPKENGSAPSAAPVTAQQAAAIAIPQMPKSEQVEAWELLMRRANALSKSDLVPQAYREKPANCLIAMEIADRIGASTFMVMQNLDVIHGTPGWRGKFLIATVNASGRFTPLRFREEGKRGTDSWGYRAVAKDKSSGEELVGPLVSWEMVKKEGWNSKSGSKWLSMPELMFHYRAGAFWSRVYCPEIGMGMHTVEELEDMRVRHVPEAIANGDPKALEAELLGETKEQVAKRAGANPETGELPHEPKSEPKVEREPGGDDR